MGWSGRLLPRQRWKLARGAKDLEPRHVTKTPSSLERCDAHSTSEMGQKLPQRLTAFVSALPLKAAAAVADRRVRFEPKADIDWRLTYLVVWR
jgi:hypothetical protein